MKNDLERICGEPESKSAIASGLFNALREDFRTEPPNGDTRILLFSDGLENDPMTVSFEEGRCRNIGELRADLANPTERVALKAALQRVVACPPLNGARVEIWLPPDAARLDRMLLLYPLWKELFVEHGAVVDIHLGVTAAE